MILDSETGGPAFPVVGEGIVQRGLTLRDYFAAKAMVAFIAEDKPDGSQAHEVEDVCDLAYFYADQMLEARQK